MKQKRRFAVLTIILFVGAAFIVPYTLLSHTKAWYGSFQFWILFAIVMIGIIIRITRSWGDEHGH